MMKNGFFASLVGVAVACASPACLAVDAWDAAVDTDNLPGNTDNVLWHTAPAQIHDLQAVGGVADVDWYLLYPIGKRSYEVQVMNVTGDADIWLGGNVARYNADGSTSLQIADYMDGGGWIMTLRWIQDLTSANTVRVRNGNTGASAASQYSIQMRETTLYCSRYNNSGTQVSVLVVQRTDADRSTACNYEVRFNNESGAEVGSTSGTLAGGPTMAVIPTSSVSGVAATRGSAYIAHTCGYGGINAKAVALEPATGFSFDTPCVTRPSM